MSGCPACDVLRAEVVYLREQNAGLVDRLLAVANPVALAQVRQPVAAAANAATSGTAESYVDPAGQVWVNVNGTPVKLEDYQRLMKGAGVPMQDGSVVPEEEYKRAMEVLDLAVSGGRLS